MKRLFNETRMYDYETIREAEKHIQKMRALGWFTLKRDGIVYIEGTDGIYRNCEDYFPFSAEFTKDYDGKVTR